MSTNVISFQPRAWRPRARRATPPARPRRLSPTLAAIVRLLRAVEQDDPLMLEALLDAISNMTGDDPQGEEGA